PLGGGQQGHDGQPGRRVDQLVEAVEAHRPPAVVLRSITRVRYRDNNGPPTPMRMAPTTHPDVAGYGTPPAWSPKETASVPPTVGPRKPRMAKIPGGTSRSWRGKARRNAPRTTVPVAASMPTTNTATAMPIDVSVRTSTPMASTTISAPTVHQ